MKQQLFHNSDIVQAGVTLKDTADPESGNQALQAAKNPLDVLENRRTLANKTLPLDQWVLAKQVHGNHLYKAGIKDLNGAAFDYDKAIANTDALYTTDPGVLIGVYTADCCGIVLVDESLPLVCVIHSGWRGTTRAITLRTIQELKKQGLNPQTTRVYFSPSLQYDSLEVGPEVIEALEKMAETYDLDLSAMIRKSKEKENKFYFDNQGINALMLESEGIPAQNMVLSSLDTGNNPELCFSFRKDDVLGEHFTYAYLKD